MDYKNALNEEQYKGATTVDGPVLLLAGAGSGKTRVLTHRVAYLIGEVGIAPYNILAITFTNKAAGEMRERVDRIVGSGAEKVWVSTFHALCVRILRRHIDVLGYDNHFTIYDTDDQKSVVKACLKKLNMDSKQYPEKMIVSEISKAKEGFYNPDEFEKMASGNYRLMQVGRVYAEYQAQLKAANALDFDDLLFKTVELFQFNPDILDEYQERFRYIMVDEYQDTNHIQFLLIKMLASKYRNLCVVGDDDQSIYKFRGANIYNILNFEEEYPEAKVIKLEQNYRSTKTILAAANSVIANNSGRKDKALWTDIEKGDKIVFNLSDSEYDEADYVISEIAAANREGRNYNDFAILYRTNAQSRIFEEKLLYRNIPYVIIGGQNFYGRKEIRDILAYLKTVDNASDNVAVRRIINVPKRGIGAASIDKAQDYADTYEKTLYDALEEAEAVPGLSRAAAKITAFTDLIESFREMIREGMALSEVYDEILDKTGYRDELIAEHTEEAQGRLENLDELRNKIVIFEENNKGADLSELLSEIALVAEVDNLTESEDRVMLMTLHSAKGLEFPVVFLAGMEDGLFPGRMAINAENDDEIEEERRLCYVGITRAKEKLYMTAARRRMLHGSSNYNPVSRFIKEIPEDIMSSNGEGQYALKKQKDILKVVSNPYVSKYNSFRPSEKSKKPAAQVQGDAPSFGKAFTIKKAEIDYKVGDRVRHIKFGEGEVTEIVSGERDYEVTVNFDRVGVKRMFASFAKLKKV